MTTFTKSTPTDRGLKQLKKLLKSIFSLTDYRYVAASILIGLVAGFGWLKQPSQQATGHTTPVGIISVQSAPGAAPTAKNTGAVEALGAAAIAPKQGDQGQGLQSAPLSIDQLIGNRDIQTKQ